MSKCPFLFAKPERQYKTVLVRLSRKFSIVLGHESLTTNEMNWLASAINEKIARETSAEEKR